MAHGTALIPNETQFRHVRLPLNPLNPPHPLALPQFLQFGGCFKIVGFLFQCQCTSLCMSMRVWMDAALFSAHACARSCKPSQAKPRHGWIGTAWVGMACFRGIVRVGRLESSPKWYAQVASKSVNVCVLAPSVHCCPSGSIFQICFKKRRVWMSGWVRGLCMSARVWPYRVALLLPRPHTPGSWHHMSSNCSLEWLCKALVCRNTW